MFKQIKALLQNPQLRQQVKAASTLEEVTRIITNANPNLTSQDLLTMVAGEESQLTQLSESDLLNVVGAAPTAYGCGVSLSCNC